MIPASSTSRISTTVITYRELRALELEILLELHRNALRETQHEFAFDVTSLSLIDVDQMYGIEIEEFPARIAEVALWLADHQANIALSEAFGQLYQRIPLKKSPHILCANALRTDWKTVLLPEKCSYILGNPPFVGKHLMTGEQGEDLDRVWRNVSGTGFLDLVTGWYALASEYAEGQRIVAAFVSTNSVCQGEQAAVFWQEMFRRFGTKIHFAHQSFKWESEARGKAHVHCVVIGFANFDVSVKRIFEYSFGQEEPTVAEVPNISPYLVGGSDTVLPIRRAPLCDVPLIVNGNKPADGGNLIIEAAAKDSFVQNNPAVAPYVRPLLSADQYINGADRWVLWLLDAPPHLIRDNEGLRQRIEAVRQFRQASPKESTRRMADRPTLFDQIRQPAEPYILIPRHSSENRRYVPFGYFGPDVIISDSCTAVPGATHYHLGILCSGMHMAWMRAVCGRIKSDYRYSNKLVYNNFPWPTDATEAQRAKVEECARGVLAAREHFSGSTLADLYDPISMPPALAKAQADLDRAVDRCYRKEAFTSDRQRVEFLFTLYEQIAAPLAKEGRKKRK
ncbi:MAG: hypothetical protein K9N23_04945 [Akkermansiaceae bacterium]|nr:hypothetical protein [Akkermansiaceae bacterium]